MRIRAAAQAVGISPDFLRRLERDGQVPPAARDVNGHRRYSPEDLEAVRRAVFAVDPRDPGEPRRRGSGAA